MTSNTPRLYLDQALKANTEIALDKAQSHYLVNVMRLDRGASIRVFNGRDGEWEASLSGKKTLTSHTQIRPQPEAGETIALYFCPLKKDRMHMLIEKATELGVSDLHPVLSDHTNAPSFRADKATAHMIEAAEQCERMTIPILHPVAKLSALALGPTMRVAVERSKGGWLTPLDPPVHLLIGPEGGWSEAELVRFQADNVTPISLGPNILRAETAAIAALARVFA